ncbi:Centrin-3 [Trebouxia sp. C0010 RCD-2024]
MSVLTYSKSPQRAARRDLTDDEVAEIQEAFQLFDSDNSGFIEYRELKAALKALGFPAKKADVRSKMAQYDQGDTGKINLQQFQLLLTDAMLSKDPADLFSRAFQLFDTTRTGGIRVQDLRMIASELGHAIEEEDLVGMIEEFDQNHDGVIDAEEFQRIMVSKEVF